MEDRLYYGSVHVDGVRLQYYRTGGEKPPVVFLHGFAESGLSWSRLPLFLRTIYDVVLLDARGHGLSDGPDTGYTMRELAGDAAAVIEALQLDRPALIGHSMGATVASLVAAGHPELVRGVVLEDPAWYAVETETQQEQEGQMGKMRQSIQSWRERSIDQLIAFNRKRYPKWDEADRFQWAKAKKQIKAPAADVYLGPKRGWQEVIQQIRCPGLVVTGALDEGALLSPAVEADIPKLWKNAQVVRIPDAGHYIHHEQFYAFRDVVRTFLRRLK